MGGVGVVDQEVDRVPVLGAAPRRRRLALGRQQQVEVVEQVGVELDQPPGQRHTAAEALGGRGQRVVKIAAIEVGLVGNAIGMGRHLALEDEDLALRERFAQVIVGPAVAEAELEDRAGQIPDHLGRQVQAGALRLEAPDVDVETAHANDLWY